MRKIIFYLSIAISSSGFSQKNTIIRPYIADEVCITNEEYKLYELVMKYRKKYKLPNIPLSKALSHVARVHSEDMEINLKELSHAWSTCEYNNSNQKTYYCMWDKPKELTSYNAKGYEIAHGGVGGYVASAESSLDGWQHSNPHNNVILNKDIWKEDKWNAIGIGIYGGFATIWFGKEEDKDGEPKVCK